MVTAYGKTAAQSFAHGAPELRDGHLRDGAGVGVGVGAGVGGGVGVEVGAGVGAGVGPAGAPSASSWRLVVSLLCFLSF